MSEEKIDSVKAANEFTETFSAIKKEVHKIIIGQDEIIDLLLISLFRVDIVF